MVYKWKTGARIKGDAQASGKLMEQLAATPNGLTARTLLEANMVPGTPLHDDYEWNDEIAADKFRLQQSNQFIDSITVVVFEEKPKGENQPRAFHITTEAHKYDALTVIVQEPDKYKVLLDNALSELAIFKRKYEMLKELQPIFKAFKEVKKQ